MRPSVDEGPLGQPWANRAAAIAPRSDLTVDRRWPRDPQDGVPSLEPSLPSIGCGFIDWLTGENTELAFSKGINSLAAILCSQAPDRDYLKTGFRHVGQVGLELLTSGDLSTLASQTARGLALSPRLECIAANMAHRSLSIPDSGDPPASASQVAGTMGVHHHTWLSFGSSVEPGSHFVARLRQDLDPLPRLECIGMIMARCRHKFLGSRTRSFYVAEAGLKLLASSNPLTLASQSIRTIGISHCT
ncbi:hypothetical protein AAY473_016365 [Plecturocebus cupreus]